MIQRDGPRYPFSWPTGWTVTYTVPRSDGTARRPVHTGVIACDAEISATTGKVMVPVQPSTAAAGAEILWVREWDIIHLASAQPSAAA